jgi:4-carboxymuconolactone decarboxylase
LADLPEELRDAVPRLLIEFCFGDFYTRSGLDLARRELLVLCLLATLGLEMQLRGHALGNLKAGNSTETMLTAMVHCLPFIGFPYALNAIRVIKNLDH